MNEQLFAGGTDDGRVAKALAFVAGTALPIVEVSDARTMQAGLADVHEAVDDWIASSPEDHTIVQAARPLLRLARTPGSGFSANDIAAHIRRSPEFSSTAPPSVTNPNQLH